MAVTIIKHGYYKPKKFETECNCGCKFIFTEEDIVVNKFGDFVRCPDCERLIGQYGEYDESEVTD